VAFINVLLNAFKTFSLTSGGLAAAALNVANRLVKIISFFMVILFLIKKF
jgi:hypothetical protein